MINNIKLKFEFLQDNIIMIKNELKNMLNKEVISLDFKERFNQFV